MKKHFVLLLTLIFSIGVITRVSKAQGSEQPSEQPSDDPFAHLEHFELPNGLRVIFAPSHDAALVNVNVEVNTGIEIEKAPDWGVAHLTEHVLFRDKSLKDDMTYLQVITAEGGEANGTTQSRQTNFTGSIPAAKGLWLAKTFSKIIFHPSITDEYVEKEKGTVELERGRPGPITLALQFNPMDYLYPRYLKTPSFVTTEFGVSFESNYTLSQEQLSTKKLTRTQVQKFYDSYYFPANMTLFVAGRFDREAMMKELNAHWASVPNRAGIMLPPLPTPKPNLKPYLRATLTEGTPQIVIGTKVWGLNLVEQEILNAHVNFLAQRLMKEVRNKKGQTYTARNFGTIFNGYGTVGISFETPKENLKENLDLVRHYFDDEARDGKVSDDDVKESIGLYLAQYKLFGKEVDGMIHLAMDYVAAKRDFGAYASPYAALESVTPAVYNATLKKYFQNDQRYEDVGTPALAFQYDYILLWVATALLCFFGLRRLLTQSFQNDRVRWVRKTVFPPLKILEGLVLFLTWFVFIHFWHVIDWASRESTYIKSQILLGHYLFGVFFVFSALVFVQGGLCLLPRKLMVMDKFLIIKSVSYFSRRIALSDIRAVETKRFLGFPFPLQLWLGAVKYRFYFFNLQFWKKGLVLHLNDGRAFFFGVSSPEKVKAELEGFLNGPGQWTPSNNDRLQNERAA